MLVNLAARLMCSAPKNGVLVDEYTQSHSSVHMKFNKFADLTLKGIEKPQATFLPLGEDTATWNGAKVDLKKLKLEFRFPELKEVETILLERETTGRVIVITGERGSGKGE
jgi:hypothetical protein